MNNKHKTQSLTQFIKYSLVGATNVIIDLIILNILSYATGITSGKMLFVFNLIAFFVYSICSYNLNKKFTFKETAPKKAYFPYASVLFFSMILNSLMLVLLTSHNPLIHHMHRGAPMVKLKHIWFNICILIDSTTIGLLGFSINKFFVFNKKKTR
ncbi:GtrA family protein [Clostridium tagluense]|uniref:GtrA family protein n=1 Tax=Clostridium TaxID=1485 RepID=UPI0013E966C9|nr:MULTISPECIES: GtrA family protein [Clostridium]MBU3126711.1 GtrA family protein [Clostridium tagluense]MBW9155001.1 GtrA family protein [Clostridium tagluense]MBZ9624613.1 GtrA family protein [Clostridium sp. FP2]MCB2310070.1 GtrA family protein [Clostridium tagluense]MCB2314400.1 GtrA family protein [Clostridium tagluense]